MSEPLVCAILLVNGREAMARRAAESFRAQSYGRKLLLMLDTGASSVCVIGALTHYMPIWNGRTIGALRNEAVALAGAVDIICHFDSDDVSHPQRIAEQVALLCTSCADCVGYYEAPFWDTRPTMLPPPFDYYGEGSAWLYRDPARKHVLGASMAFWRKTWERHPFDDLNTGEDYRFCGRCKTVAVSAIETVSPIRTDRDVCEPRIICGIHGSNTSPGYDFTKRQQCFRRAPEFDSYCARVMRLETK